MSAPGDHQDAVLTPPVHALSPIHSTMPTPTSGETRRRDRPTAELTRSATYTNLTALETDREIPPIKRTFSENMLSLPLDSKAGKVNNDVQSTNLELLRRTSRKMKRKMSTAARFSLSPDEEDDHKSDARNPFSENGEQPKTLGRSVAGTFRSLARKSWAGSSRSSSESPARNEKKERSWSPSKNKAVLAASSIAVPQPAVAAPLSRPSSHEASIDTTPAQPLPNDLQPHLLQKPLSALQSRNKSETSFRRLSRNSSSTSLKSWASTERSRSRLSLGRPPPMPPSLSSDRLAALNSEISRKKDPLWSAFRSIESEYVSFSSKTSLQKAKVLRGSLLPFLTKYAQHHSNQNLRAEDLDRRIVVLNKWWTGLLEMLHGAGNHPISGTDRPAFLEAATAIMMRAEWRAPPFTSATGDSPLRSSIQQSKSTNSLESDEADFLTDTVHQNVRNMFVQNLLSQMAFVVDKLSMRSAPASLVTFAGKACAYAFFFCPGVADMLARLWCLPPGTMRRVFSEFGSERGDKLDLVSKALAANLPPPVRSLAVSSQAGLSRYLQRRTQLPQGSEHVRWYGPWIGRWCGRDSDLFFVFTKHYHALVAEFLTEQVSLKDRAGIPGMIPVCAQMLVVLETTIYRQAGQPAVDNYSTGTANYMDNPDALAPLPMTIANASRSISENRLIMLLKDICNDTSAEGAIQRNLFLESFDAVTKAAARKISLYNNDACFVICDFMEEVLPVMFRYNQSFQDTPVTLDWPFWLQVCQRMLQSQTTLTQIRLIAFLYTTWSTWTLNEERKREFVLEWLLESSIFEPLFCHWSSMVRHYFYRLLCWRVARCDGEVSLLDIEILQTLAIRLNKLWAHYQYLKAESEMRETPQPSCIPCSPAPNRYLVIIRTDSQPILVSPMPNFDKFLPSGLVNQSSPYQSHSSALSSIPSADSQNQPSRKRWSLFKGFNVFGMPPGNLRPGEVTPPGTPDEKAHADPSSDHVPGPNSAVVTNRAPSRPATPPHQTFSFKFSLEWNNQRMDQRNPRKMSPPTLPTNAQNVLEKYQNRQSSSSGGSGGSVSTTSMSGGGSSAGSSSGTSEDAKMRTKTGELKPLKPGAHETSIARYSGRALAEWRQVLGECGHFYHRRRLEGVPRDNLIETPTLGVETFRLAG